MTKRAWWLAAAVYVLLRVLIIIPIATRVHNDTFSYRSGISFIGSTSRTWVYPVVLAALNDRQVIALQAAVSGVAFITLAVAIGSTIVDSRVRYAIGAVILAFGLAPRLTAWDAVILTESLAVSLTAILVAALIWFDKVPWWAFSILFTIWMFLRDAHLFTGILVVIGLTVHAFRTREWIVPAICSTVIVWGGLAQMNDKTVEAFSVAFNVAYRVDDDADAMNWFLDHGMPASPAFTEQEFFFEVIPLYEDPTFRTWAETDGPVVYMRFVASHPSIALQGIERILIDGDTDDEAFVDDTSGRTFRPVGLPIWPSEASKFTAALMAAALLASLLVARSDRLDKRWLLPSLFIASTLPLAMLTYHAALIEFGRHGLVITFVLVISCLWIVALSVDVAVNEPLATEPE